MSFSNFARNSRTAIQVSSAQPALLRRSLWSSAFGLALGATLVPSAMAQSSDEVQELRQEVQELKAQVDAMKKATPAPAPVAAAPMAAPATTESAGLTPVMSKGAALKVGPLTITPGGFIAGESIYRSRNTTADVGSNFTQLPFANNTNYYNSEFRESARQSRLQALIQGPQDTANKLEAFYAMDFLSAGVTSNSNESNSYTMRVREAYADWKNTDHDFYVLFGQTWSLATMYKQGLTPRTENAPLTIEAQYVAGFQWLRNPEVRFVKNFGNFAALGVALESPQDLVKGSVAGSSDTNPGQSLLNSSNYSDDKAPDVIVKAAFDPGFGHYELYSLTRFFYDRGESTPGTLNTEANHTTTAESIGGGMILPIVPKYLSFQASGIVGHGNGRYGSSTLGDSAYNPTNGSIGALEEQQILLGLVGHPTSSLEVYGYAGMEHLASSYGYGVSDNSACDVNLVEAPKGKCSGIISTVRQGTVGFWWTFYKGSLGHANTGLQYSYTRDWTFADAKNIVGTTDDNMVFFSLRYYPFQ